MNPLENDEQKYRIVTALAALIVALVFIGMLTMILPAPEGATGKVFLSDVLLGGRGPDSLFPMTIQNLMWFMFFIGISELWIRFNRASTEAEQLQKNLLPEDDEAMLRAKDLGPIFRKIAERKQSRYFFVQRLIQRVILQFQGSQSIDQANNLMNSSLELMQHEIELKYNMLRYLVWLIPTLGFIGTVVGIALALSETSAMPDIAEGGSAIREWLGVLTTELGIAFNTTLLALIMSAFLVFLLHIVQGREEMALNSAGQYCMDNLINRLYEDKEKRR